MTLPRGFLDRPFAHRALHDETAPENSMAAIRSACAAGYGIEIDVQPSRDGVAMVFHDDTLDRVTGETGPIAELTADRLAEIRLKDGGTIPRLTEALALVDARVPLVVELKDQTGHLGETDGTLETAVARAVADYAGPLAVMSFNPHMIARMRDLAPRVPRGLTTCAFASGTVDAPADRLQRLRDIADFDAVGASFISHEASDLASARVAQLHRAGAGVLCWTVRSAAQAERAYDHADQITFEGFRPA